MKKNLIGYTGQNCDQIINLCNLSICKNNALCLPILNNVKCLCPKGYTGAICDQKIDPCQSFPCANGAACTSLITGYQ